MTRDAGFDDFLDAVEEGEPYYLESSDGDAYLPPLARDPTTGEGSLTEQPLPEPGEILAHTTTHVPTPQFDEDAPYITAIVSFGPVDLTGQVREVDPENVDIGQSVELGIEHSETTDERVLVFYPAP